MEHRETADYTVETDKVKRTAKTAKMGRLTLGDGMPAICVPVMGKTLDELREATVRAVEAKADMIELRMDSYIVAPTQEQALEACQVVREAAGDTPILFTLRTLRDGGSGHPEAASYEPLLGAVARSGLCDGVDAELSVGESVFARIAEAAHEAGVTIVGSSHEFGHIDNPARAVQWLKRQQALGADVCKVSVMAHTYAEAMELAAAYARANEILHTPMVGIVMGPCGAITRIGAACMGSCLTFGTAGAQSAPGQMDALRLRTALEIVQDAIS